MLVALVLSENTYSLNFKAIKYLILAILLYLLFRPIQCSAPPAPPPQTVNEKITTYAKKYNVSSSLMTEIIKKESNFNPNAIGDKHIKCGHSRGLVQISKCYHPEISDEKAFDVDFSIEYLAKELSKGHCRQWSTCPIQ